jgi:hypothetical protein
VIPRSVGDRLDVSWDSIDETVRLGGVLSGTTAKAIRIRVWIPEIATENGVSLGFA